MLSRRQFIVATAVAANGWKTTCAAETRIRDTRTIAAIPQTGLEIKELHDRAIGYAAELLPENEAFEVKSFAPFLTKRDEIEGQKRLPNTCTRRHALSVGLEMLSDDQKQLPVLSREQILSYLKTHYVSVQARVYREPISRALYLGPRCLAATRSFQGSRLTKAFSPTVAQALDNTRSLGLLLPKNVLPTPSNLRTLVLVHKNQLSQEKSKVAKTNYEYLFIRAQEASPDHLDLHAFATSDDRTKLHWLRHSDSPTSPPDCSVRGAVHFTEYSHQGLYPKTAVIRRSLITGRMTFAWDEIDAYAQKTFGHSAVESLTEVLDAILKGDIKETTRGVLPRSPLLEKPPSDK